MYRKVFNFSFFCKNDKIKVGDKMKNIKGFNLISVIIIIFVTSIASAITAGVIVTNNYKSKNYLFYFNKVIKG